MGAIVGIVIDIAVVVSAAVVGIVFFLRRRKKDNSHVEAIETQENNQDDYIK